jgi:hypothetical protein
VFEKAQQYRASSAVVLKGFRRIRNFRLFFGVLAAAFAALRHAPVRTRAVPRRLFFTTGFAAAKRSEITFFLFCS